VDEGLKRYRHEVGGGTGTHWAVLIPDDSGPVVYYSDHVAATEAMRKALEAIRDDGVFEGFNDPALIARAALAARAAVQGTERKDAARED